MKQTKIALILSKHHPILIEQLQLIGFECLVYLNKNIANLSQDVRENVSVIVTSNSYYILKDTIDLLPNLTFIGRLGSGMEIIDTNYAQSKGIYCCSSPAGNANAVAEHALGLLLDCLNNITISHQELINGVFKRLENTGREISDLKIGIIGYGNNGKRFADILSFLGAELFIYDIVDKNIRQSETVHFSKELSDIIINCNCISFHIPINDRSISTANEVMNGMLNPYILINCARGGLVDINLLFELIESGKIISAGIDVWESEPTINLSEEKRQKLHFLLNSNKIIGTPHIAGYSHQATYKMSKIIADHILYYFK